MKRRLENDHTVYEIFSMLFSSVLESLNSK